MKSFLNLTSFCLAAMLLVVIAAKCPPKETDENNQYTEADCSSITEMDKCIAPSCKVVGETCEVACSKVALENCGIDGSREDCEVIDGVCADKEEELAQKTCAEKTKEECGEGCKLVGDVCNSRCEDLLQEVDCNGREDCKYDNDTCVDNTTAGNTEPEQPNDEPENVQPESDKPVPPPVVQNIEGCEKLNKDKCNGTKLNDTVCVYNNIKNKCQAFPVVCKGIPSNLKDNCINNGCIYKEGGFFSKGSCNSPCHLLLSKSSCDVVKDHCKSENNKCVPK